MCALEASPVEPPTDDAQAGAADGEDRSIYTIVS